MQWLLANWQSVLSVLGIILSAVVAILQMFHKTSVAADLQAIQQIVAKLSAPNPPSPPAA